MSSDVTDAAFKVRTLELADVDRYLAQADAVDAESGVAGAPHSHPYGRHEPSDHDEAVERERRRWTTPLDHVGWRRAWGLFVDDDELVGSAYLAGSMFVSGLHRAELGMGIDRAYRRRGGGDLLLTTVIGWARGTVGLDWIDLGVFGDNPRARALYERHGFEPIGSMVDRFRVDGVSLDDVTMTLRTSRLPEPRSDPTGVS